MQVGELICGCGMGKETDFFSHACLYFKRASKIVHCPRFPLRQQFLRPSVASSL